MASSSSDNFCDICWANPRAKIVFVPCGHARFRNSCAHQLFATTKKCDICRREIDLLLPVFWLINSRIYIYYGFYHVPRKETLRYFVFLMCTWIAETFLLQLTCFNCTVDRICASGFLSDITYFNYSEFLVHGHYLAFLLLHISSSWSLVDVSVTWHVQSMTITLRFSYSAFPSPVKTLFLLLGISRLPYSSRLYFCDITQIYYSRYCLFSEIHKLLTNWKLYHKHTLFHPFMYRIIVWCSSTVTVNSNICNTIWHN